MKILIISGFLGAGKTTFLRHLIEKTKRDFCILENEYGEVGIDAKRLEQTALAAEDPNKAQGEANESEANETDADDKPGQLKVWELAEGCICCSMQSDFAEQVLTIAAAIDPEFLLVEPTGVGMLGNILKNLKRVAYERIEVLQPITIVDAREGLSSLTKFPEIADDQISYAGRIVISKTENVDESEIAPLVEKLREINPTAPIHQTPYLTEDASWWEALLVDHARIDDESSTDAKTPDLETYAAQSPTLPTREHLLLFLEDLIRGAYGDIVRAKGAVKCDGEILRFDVVGKTYAIIGEEADETTAIFIGQNLRRDAIRKYLVPLRRRAVKLKRRS